MTTTEVSGVAPARQVVDRWLTSTQPAVIFDFNGTLSDDERILFDIFSELFTTHLQWQMTPADYRDRLLGRSDREIIEYAVTHHGAGGEDDVDELLRLRAGHYKQRVADESPITEATVGLVKLLAERSIPIGIVTGAQRDDVLTVLDNSPAGQHIRVLVAEEDVTNGKPDPEGFLTAARLMRRRPSDILVFEDSVPGVLATLAARMHCIAVSTDASADLTDAAPAIIAELSADLLARALPPGTRDGAEQCVGGSGVGAGSSLTDR